LIPVIKQPEPLGFDRTVRQPGLKFLAENPNTNFKGRCNYWINARMDLYNAYNKVCAYSCFYLVTDGTIDHFLPKKKYPTMAYEWSNYRLALPRINSYKGDSTNIIDPFIVQNGWFLLDFPSCLVKAGSNLSQEILDQISNTIDELRLNDDDFLVQERCEIMLSYANEELPLSFLEKRYPFLATEINRQELTPASAKFLFKKRS
jgi:hypothetical protein